MGKVIDGGLAPKDHPLFTGGWTIHTHKTLGQAIKELEKDIEEQNKKEKPQKEAKNNKRKITMDKKRTGKSVVRLGTIAECKEANDSRVIITTLRRRKKVLPPRPKSFKGICNIYDPMPENVRPKGSPRNTGFVCSTEWMWGPCNNRCDKYYLNPRGPYWLLWIGEHDGNWNTKWEWILYAYAKKKGVDAKTAAVYLLLDAWTAEADRGAIGHYHFIDCDGLLSVSEISEIARRVWPEESQAYAEDPN